jgi:5-methylcytosine-specific restriction endonuclease McrA
MVDDNVTRRKGIYPYVLSRNEKHLAVRAFTEAQRRAAYEKQKGVCLKCGKHFEIEQMEADHITPWSKGGKTDATNCGMLCLEDNRRKGAV